MSLPVLLALGAVLYAAALGFLYCLGRIARDPEPGWGPTPVPPSAEVLEEMRRHGEIV